MSSCAERVLEVEHLRVAYGSRTVLTDVTLDVLTPGITVVMGPAGTGKSTLLQRLAGLAPSARLSQGGSIRYLGVPLDRAPSKPVLVHQPIRELGRPLIDGLRDSMRGNVGVSGIDALRRLACERFAHYGVAHLEAQLERDVADLAPVDIRLIGLLRAALTGARLILVDEPTAGLSDLDAERVLALLRRIGSERACLMTTHHQRHARDVADWAILMAGGRVQVAQPASAFFRNTLDHPILAQLLRTGSCFVPAPDAASEDSIANPTPARAESAPMVTARSVGIAVAQPAPADALALLRPRHRQATVARTVVAAERRGPEGFHWLVPGQLAGCPMPGIVAALEHDLTLLRRMGITRLINLTERAVSPTFLAKFGLRNYTMAIEDQRAPPLMWAKLLLAKMRGFIRNGDVLAVHCLAGLGRTGTVLAAWLIDGGLSADEALRQLRAIDPGYVQSVEQENLLHELEVNQLARLT